MSEPQPHQLGGPLSVLVTFLGGIAGVTAGVSALLSGAGFLLLRAHANLLGISSVLYHSVGDYLYEGGIFFLSTFLWALPASIIGNIYGWIFMGFVTLYLVVEQFTTIGGSKISLKLKTISQQSWFRWVCVVLATFLLLSFIYRLLPSPEAKDLLFPSGSQKEIVKRASQIGELEYRYVQSVLYVILSGVIVWGIKKIHNNNTKKSLSVLLYAYDRISARYRTLQKETTPEINTELFSSVGLLFCYLLFLIELVLLPVKYGQTVSSNEFHKVADLTLDDEKLQGKVPRSEKLWLLNETSDMFVLYSGDTQEVFLVQREQVLNIIIKGQENVFQGR